VRPRRRRRRRLSAALALLVLVAVALALAALLDAPSQAARVASSRHDCGGHERWRVKTLSDPGAKRVNFTPRRTKIERLRAEPVPVRITPSTPRLDGVETTTYKVRATLLALGVSPTRTSTSFSATSTSGIR
jgi:hypothetical protein